MSLSDRDRELAKKHALPFTIDSSVLTVIGFSPTNLAAFLAERDALAIKEKDDAVSSMFEEWANSGLWPALVFNDNGYWAVTFEGNSAIDLDEPPTKDSVVSCFVEADQWKPTIQEALQHAIRALIEPKT
jgi:hypothetical protein